MKYIHEKFYVDIEPELVYKLIKNFKYIPSNIVFSGVFGTTLGSTLDWAVVCILELAVEGVERGIGDWLYCCPCIWGDGVPLLELQLAIDVEGLMGGTCLNFHFGGICTKVLANLLNNIYNTPYYNILII